MYYYHPITKKVLYEKHYSYKTFIKHRFNIQLNKKQYRHIQEYIHILQSSPTTKQDK